MEKILIIVDSPGDLNQRDIQDLPVWIAPVRILYNNREYRESTDIDIHEYWKTLEILEEVPTTVQVTPPEWQAYYQKAASEGYTHVLVHTISATASGNFSSANIGAELYRSETAAPITVCVTDSRSYSFIYGRNVLETARHIQQGAGFKQAVDMLQDLSSRSRAMLWAYSLKHLKKSGRISGMAAFVGETLGLRPVLYIKDGLIAPVDRVRGDKNLIPRAIEIAKKHVQNPEEQVMAVIYADVPPEEVERACQIVREQLSPKEIILHEIGCAITTNCGPVSMALCFYGKPFQMPG